MSHPKPSEFARIHLTGEGFRTVAVYRAFFRAALREEIQRRADYDREVADWYENGDGRPVAFAAETRCHDCGAYLTQGVPPFQNAARWYASGSNGGFCPERDGRDHQPVTRSVNIGGQGYAFPHCIHGSSLVTDYDNICGGCEEGSTAIEDAIVRGRERFLRFLSRWEWAIAAPGDLAYETRRELMQWAASLFPDYTPKED